MSEITTFGGKTTVREPGREADLAVEDLLARVGDRVRKARELKGLPRRVISETSGVSMRYLAQLEAGEGNISIGLLKRVALALDMPLDWLLGEEDPWNSDVLRFSEAYRQATAEVRRRAEAIGRDAADLCTHAAGGTVDQLVDTLGRWSDAGADRVYLQVLDLDDLDHVRLLGGEVLPHLT